MKYMTIQKNIQNSPRKLRLVADMIRKMTPSQAVEALSFTTHTAAVPLAKAIKTAVANAKKETVVFEKIEINEGMKLKRNRIGTAGRGRSRPYKRRWSHIKIVLTDEVQEKALSVKGKVRNEKTPSSSIVPTKVEGSLKEKGISLRQPADRNDKDESEDETKKEEKK